MMNELFVLGELMEGVASGYQLCHAMQASLGRYRKISYGVMYPLLDKLASNGLIALSNESGGRNKNIASITEKGRERFFQLMDRPVPGGAYTEDIFMIKLDAMQHLAMAQQFKLLDKFLAEQTTTVEETRLSIEKLLQEDCVDHWYARKKMELRLQQAVVAIQWAEEFRTELERKQKSIGKEDAK